MIAVNSWIEPIFSTSMEKIHIRDKKADLNIYSCYIIEKLVCILAQNFTQ